MSLSRRTFAKEFRKGAVRRLALGVSVAEVARGVPGSGRGSRLNRGFIERVYNEKRVHSALG